MHSTINPRRSSNKANLPILPNTLANASDPTLVEKEAQITDLKPKVLKHVRFVEPLPRYKASLLGENEKVEHPTQPTWNFDGIETQDPSKTVRGSTSKNRLPLEDIRYLYQSSDTSITNDMTTTEPKLNFDMLDSLKITDPSKTVRGPSSRKGRSLADLHKFLSSSATPKANDMTSNETSNETNNAAPHLHVSKIKKAKRKCCAKVKKFFKLKIFSFK
ncbi:hypothetical protein ACO0QE_000594 [Hanseniaspora vineae]